MSLSFRNLFSALSLEKPEEEAEELAAHSAKKGTKGKETQKTAKKEGEQNGLRKTRLKLPLVWLDLEMTGEGSFDQNFHSKLTSAVRCNTPTSLLCLAGIVS